MKKRNCVTGFRFSVLRRHVSIRVGPVGRIDSLAGHGRTTEPGSSEPGRILRRVQARPDVRSGEGIVSRSRPDFESRRRTARLEGSGMEEKISAARSLRSRCFARQTTEKK
jgi:hypothetical protein